MMARLLCEAADMDTARAVSLELLERMRAYVAAAPGLRRRLRL